MPFIPDRKTVLERLSNAKNLQFVSLKPLSETRAVLKLLWSGAPVTLHISVAEVLEYSEPDSRGYDVTASGKVRTRGRAPTGQNAVDSDMPYRDEATFRALLSELGSYRAVADRLGVSENTISKWGRDHGLDERRPQPTQKQRAEWVRDIQQRIETGTMPSQKALADEWGISKASVNRLVKRARE